MATKHEPHADAPKHPHQKPEDTETERLLAEKPHDYIERTKPEDPVGGTRPGQLTRDNVNPNIPSGDYQPNPADITGTQDQSGGLTPPAPEPLPEGTPYAGSVNEPVADEKPAAKAAEKSAGTRSPPLDQDEQQQDEQDDESLPPKGDLEDMTRAELDNLADDRGVDTTGCSTKADVIDALRKDYRKKKRAAAKED